MKIYLLSLLLVSLLFSCNQKPISDNQKTEIKEIVKKEKAKTYNFYSYTNIQLDSFFQVYRDSLLDTVQKNKFDKDTILRNEFSQVMYGMAANDFPAFAFVEDKYCDIGGEDFECKSFLYYEKNSVFEIEETFTNQNSLLYAWYDTEIERRDMNFDGKLDIIIKRPWHLVSRSVADHILILNSNSKNTEIITSTFELHTNPKNQTVISFSDGGNFGTHYKTINKWQSDSLVKIRHLEKSYDNKGKFTLEEFAIKNGKEIKIKSQKMNSDKAEEYFENYK